MSQFTSEKDLLKMLENYKKDPDIIKIEEIMMKEIDYKVAEMTSPNDKILFRGINDIDYRHIFDENPYFSVGIFVLPKHTVIPFHNHKNMIVFTKLLCGKAEIKSYDKITNVDLDENKFEVKLIETKIFKEGDLTILTPFNKNIHEITALEDTAFFDILIPDYSDKNHCVYYKLLQENYKTYLKRV